MPWTRLSSRPGDTPVALAPTGTRTLDELLRAAGGVRREARRGGRWLLACEDPFAFLAGMLGLLGAGCGVILPPNFLPGTQSLLGREADGVLGGLPPDGEPLSGAIPDGDLEFWTSGSTGTPKRVARRFSQLSAEVEVLERLFGASFAGGPVLGTVPHHHIYGCLFRLLWPLAAGRPFVTAVCGDPDRFATALSQTQAPVLVSSPAHLARLPRLVDMDAFRTAPSAIFSSGGPLRAEDARLWRRWVPSGITEIYGSTESGGIAWRKQGAGVEPELKAEGEADGEAWHPFPDVTLALEADGALQISTARVAGGTLRMEDAASLLPGGRFRLLGRLDRVVKVEEKRVSLPELEAALESHPGVRRAAVVLLPGARSVLGAVVVPSGPLPEAPRAFSLALRGHLEGRFEPAALPRRWRFVTELPADSRGKVTPSLLAECFA